MGVEALGFREMMTGRKPREAVDVGRADTTEAAEAKDSTVAGLLKLAEEQAAHGRVEVQSSRSNNETEGEVVGSQEREGELRCVGVIGYRRLRSRLPLSSG